MTSYRGVEAIDCVGMQPVVEPGLGLCGNLKPNRFWELNENAFKGLACARLFIFTKEKEIYGSLTTVCIGLERNN